MSPALAAAVVDGDLTDLQRAPGWPTADTLDGLRIGLAGTAPGEPDLGWFVVRRDTGEIIGDCGWKGGPDPTGTAEIGYGMAAPLRGRGYGGEAVGGLASWALSQPGCRRLTAEVRTENLPSRRLLERLGFTLWRSEPPHVWYERGR